MDQTVCSPTIDANRRQPRDFPAYACHGSTSSAISAFERRCNARTDFVTPQRALGVAGKQPLTQRSSRRTANPLRGLSAAELGR